VITDELRALYECPSAVIALDTETTSLRVGGDARTIGVSYASVAGGRVVSGYIPIAHDVGQNASPEILEQLHYVISVQPRTLVFCNAQFDILALEAAGLPTEHQDILDVSAIAHLLNENEPRSKSLDSLAEFYLGEEAHKLSSPELDRAKKTGWKGVPPEMVAPYATTDAELTYGVWLELTRQVEYDEVISAHWQHKQKLIRVLLAMRRRGVRVDTALASHSVEVAEHEMARVREHLGINPGSPKDLEATLHGFLKLPVLHRTPGGKPRFDKAAMADYDELLERVDSPVGKLLKEYRGWQKASSAAYKPYLALLDHDGRLRCSYKMHGTVTGRLSCSEPNLQQIPKTSDKPWNGRVKECFIADPGYTLINVDYSQLELRLATAYAPDPKLVDVFNEGRDIFTEMSQQLGMARQDTKTLVYSMQYGAGINRLMTAFHVKKDRAEELRTNYQRTYPLFHELNQRVSRQAERDGFVRTWTGRKRRFQYPSDSYRAMNAMIQGGGADIVERVMVRLFEEVDSDDCRMLLQVHDSITFEIRTELVALYAPLIRRVMEDVEAVLGFDPQVRFAVDITPWSEVDRQKLAGAGGQGLVAA
jgi:DNA polymerase-1